ncbi:MAG: DUF342 domain-containing protein [Lawsonibacter sp.]|jgi:uncharacterized protein (DUF342 family)
MASQLSPFSPASRLSAVSTCTHGREFPSISSGFTFPPEHALSSLWQLWSGQMGSLHLSPFPDGFPAQIPDFCDPAQEMAHLQAAITRAAYRRLSQVLQHLSDTVLDNLDETATIFLSSDQMVAWLLFFPPVGSGRPLDQFHLSQLLNEHGIQYGTRTDLFDTVLKNPARYFQLFPIACGTPPLPGSDGQVLDLYPRYPAPNPQVEALDQANYISLNLVQDIAEGDAICQIVPPSPGSDGSTVTGTCLPAPAGQPAEIPQGRNTHLSDDGLFLLASRSGHLTFSGRCFQVKPVLDLPAHPPLTPQCIKFLGDVHVRGDLRGGIEIYAIGNVQVDGVIEDCSIEAGENIIVSSGVQGQGRAILRAQKSVYAKYLEHCHVYARESVQADCIISSEIYSNGSVEVHTGRGAIIGGAIHAARQVRATTVGSKSECPTLIFLGGQPCEENERVQILQKLQAVQQNIHQLELTPDDPNTQKELSKLRLTQCVAKMKLEKFDHYSQETIHSQMFDPRRLICDTVYPGTRVAVGHDAYRITQVEHQCAFGLSDGFVGKIQLELRGDLPT